MWFETPLVIRRRTGWRALDIRGLWAYRDLLLLFGLRELRLRYRQTLLGVSWVIFQPLLGAAVMAFVFGRVAGLASQGTPYFVLAFVGLVGWSLFSGIVTKATSCLVNYPQLITKVAFPRLVVPLSTAIPPLADAAISLAILLPIAHAYGIPLTGRFLLAPVWLFALMTCALGLGFVLSSLAVAYRDVQHLLPFALQVLLFASPVAYSSQAVPERFRHLYRLNPVAVFVDGLRDAVFGRATPVDGALIAAAAVTTILLFGGALLFVKRERWFADVV